MPQPRRRTVPDTPAPPASVLAALYKLHHLRDEAAKLDFDPRDAGIPVKTLLSDGLTAADVKMLVDDRLAAVVNGRSRSRRPRLTPTSTLVLTRAGEVTLGDWVGFAVSMVKPRWDGGRRELWFGDRLVKRWHAFAANQEIVLAVFEEEGWPPRIDDPLPMVDGLVPRERLRETVKRLNREQADSVLTFYRDGSGEGVAWRANVGEVFVVTSPRRVPVAV